MTALMDSSRARSVRKHASRAITGLLCATPILALVGCSNSGQRLQADLYQRELRLQEDEIYRLEDYIEEYQAIIRGYRIEVADLKKQLKQPGPTSGPPETSTGPELLPSGDTPDSTAPAFVPGGIEIESAEPVEAVPYEEDAPLFVPAPSDTGSTPSEPRLLFTGGAPDHASEVRPAIAEAAPPTPYSELPEGESRRAKEIKTQLAVKDGPVDLSGASTLLVSVATGEIPHGSEMSFLLTAPQRTGEARRVARWDFLQEEVAQAETDDVGRKELLLMLPADAPQGETLRLWARWLNETGEKELHTLNVRLTGEPLRLVSRLPAAEQSVKADPEPLPEANEPEQSGWRRALVGPYRDPAVRTASYSEIDPPQSD